MSTIQSFGVRKSINDFNSAEIKKTKTMAEMYYKQLGKKSPFFRAWFGDRRAYDRTPVIIANVKGSKKYSVHRILLPDGSSFKFSEKNNEVKQESYQGVTENSSLADTTSFTSVNSILNSIKNVKQKQLDIINEVNPAPNSYLTWIRKVDDIKTLAETLEDSDWSDGDKFNPDLTRSMIEEAIESGEITVFSSYPIEQGVFVSPSYMEAESYSGDGNVYERTVNINDVAWIDPTQGMYANTGEEVKYSLPLSNLNDLHQSNIEKVTELGRVAAQLTEHINYIGSSQTKRTLSLYKQKKADKRLL